MPSRIEVQVWGGSYYVRYIYIWYGNWSMTAVMMCQGLQPGPTGQGRRQIGRLISVHRTKRERRRGSTRALMEGTAQFIHWKLRRRREIAGERGRVGEKQSRKSTRHEMEGTRNVCLPMEEGTGRTRRLLFEWFTR